MPSSQRDLLRGLLRRPQGATTLTISDWDLVVRQARRAGLLARLACCLEEEQLLSAVPAEPRRHLEAEQAVARKLSHDVRREVRRIAAALAGLETPIVLLKGAAYVMAGLPAAAGRLFNDIDIMVPRERLDAVETALRAAGWVAGDIDPYDERYYRRWMHQIPPLTHGTRGTTVDTHHTIVARTTRLELRASKLFAAAVPLASDPALSILAPADMVLHSATHLLNEGDFDRGLRDLDDLHRLMRHFGRDPAFWETLVARAAELDLRRPLFYALRYCRELLGTPVPERIAAASALQPPGPLLSALMDPLFERALRPSHASCRDGLSGIALFVLYIRAHWMLMPVRILVPHLLRKAVMRWRGAEAEPAAPEPQH
ncbi:MAG TPA: nucleotidyltransferase family protein [Stellaceae bacterium]|nr:nucleotidyltransferase family protein [Stellaceae bacterium]